MKAKTEMESWLHVRKQKAYAIQKRARIEQERKRAPKRYARSLRVAVRVPFGVRLKEDEPWILSDMGMTIPKGAVCTLWDTWHQWAHIVLGPITKSTRFWQSFMIDARFLELVGEEGSSQEAKDATVALGESYRAGCKKAAAAAKAAYEAKQEAGRRDREAFEETISEMRERYERAARSDSQAIQASQD